MLGRSALAHIEPGVLTGLRFTCALPLLAVIATTQGALVPSAVTAADWGRLVLLAVISGLVGMMLYYRGLRRTPASIATFAELAFPASALVINYVVLGATIDAVQLIGFFILWATIALLHWVPVRYPRHAARQTRRRPASRRAAAGRQLVWRLHGQRGPAPLATRSATAGLSPRAAGPLRPQQARRGGRRRRRGLRPWC